MFRNYLKTTVRNLLRNKGYSVISIIGLAAGIAICLLIFLVIQFELSYDEFHSKKDRVYRILTKYHGEIGGVGYTSGVPFPLPATIRNEFPQLEKSAGIVGYRDMQVMVLDKEGNKNKKFNEKKGVYFLEPDFFDIFDFSWLSGNPAASLADPQSAVLTKEIAEKYFGDWRKAVGNTIRIDGVGLLKITGILNSIPANTDFQFKVVIPYELTHLSESTDWASTFDIHQCYVLLPPSLTQASFDNQLVAFSRKYKPVEMKDIQVLQPLQDVHYDAVAVNFSGKTISRERIRGMWLIAGFILLIAGVNFVNLATSQAVNRAKEIGVRKVLGSNKFQLKMQFFMETALIVLTGVFLAVIIALLLTHLVGQMLDIPLSLKMLINPRVLLFLVAVTLGATALAGFYPSLILSGFNPIEALKSKQLAKGVRGISLRRALVVFQFVIAQVLIIGTIFIVQQMNYLQNSSMGFEREAIVTIPIPSDSANALKFGYLRNTVLNLPGAQQISLSTSAPANEDDNWTSFRFDNRPKETDFFAINKGVDSGFINTYQLSLIAGRNLRESDSIKEFLVNESIVKQLGFKRPEEVLHKQIDLWNGFAKGEIVGVVKDFHASSLKNAMAPVFMFNFKNAYHIASIKLTSSKQFATMAALEKIWSDVFPDFAFEYQFLDERIDAFYKKEKQLAQLYQLFAVLAILLSCLGLYGLTSFMAVQRLKEVGIRRVLGATKANIIYLFSKEFMLLIGIALVLAFPIAGYFIYQWLQNYAYRIDMNSWVFLLGGLISILIALITISFQAFRAALSNPVRNLRSE